MTVLHIFEDMEMFGENQLEAALGIVSAPRRDNAMKQRSLIHRKQCVIAELLLLRALNTKQLPEIAVSATGKPDFTDKNLPRFNISHCKTAVVCAIADTQVGVDAESYRNASQQLVEYVMNAEEQRKALENPKTFAEIWTKKESYVKYTGDGLTLKLPNLLNKATGVRFYTIHSDKGYACTVCLPDTETGDIAVVSHSVADLLSLDSAH